METQSNVVALHSGQTPLVDTLYQALRSVLNEERFATISIAAAIGALELVKLDAYNEWAAAIRGDNGRD